MRAVVDLRVRIEYDYVCNVSGCEDLHSNWSQYIGPVERGSMTTDRIIREVGQQMIKNNLANKDLPIRAIVNHKVTDYTLME